MPPRRLYRRLMSLPAWGLYRGAELVATIRAEDAHVARGLFEAHGLGRKGDRVRRLP